MCWRNFWVVPLDMFEGTMVPQLQGALLAMCACVGEHRSLLCLPPHKWIIVRSCNGNIEAESSLFLWVSLKSWEGNLDYDNVTEQLPHPLTFRRR